MSIQTQWLRQHAQGMHKLKQDKIPSTDQEGGHKIPRVAGYELQCKATNPRIFGQQKLDPVGLKNKKRTQSWVGME